MNETTRTRFRLLPSIRVARYAGRCYVFDAASRIEPVLDIPTQAISEPLYQLLCALLADPARVWDREALIRGARGAAPLVDKLISRGYLEAVAPDVDAPRGDDANACAPSSSPLDIADERRQLDEKVRLHHLSTPRFFGLPEVTEPAQLDVALVGVPVSSVCTSLGTRHGPELVRWATRAAHSGFDVWRDGVYSELGCDGGPPRVLCKGAVIGDLGDLGSDAATVGALFDEIDRFVEAHVAPNRLRPLLFGGDHAITFPVLDAIARRQAGVHLIQLDAHNDLFYVQGPAYGHHAVTGNLLLHSPIAAVHQLGVRTLSEGRVARYEQLASEPQLADRFRLYSASKTRQRIAANSLREILPRGAPCYLTIDLDVVDAQQVGALATTPVPDGLSWTELYEAVDQIFDAVDVVGCDVVEINAWGGASASGVVTLALLLVDRLARQARPS